MKRLELIDYGTGIIAVHDLATKGPDYEVIKEMFGSDVAVEYKK